MYSDLLTEMALDNPTPEYLLLSIQHLKILFLYLIIMGPDLLQAIYDDKIRIKEYL